MQLRCEPAVNVMDDVAFNPIPLKYIYGVVIMRIFVVPTLYSTFFPI